MSSGLLYVSMRDRQCRLPALTPLVVIMGTTWSPGLDVLKAELHGRASWGCGEPGSGAGQARHAGLFGQGWHCAFLGCRFTAAPGNCTSRSHSHGQHCPYPTKTWQHNVRGSLAPRVPRRNLYGRHMLPSLQPYPELSRVLCCCVRPHLGRHSILDFDVKIPTRSGSES